MEIIVPDLCIGFGKSGGGFETLILHESHFLF